MTNLPKTSWIGVRGRGGRVVNKAPGISGGRGNSPA